MRVLAVMGRPIVLGSAIPILIGLLAGCVSSPRPAIQPLPPPSEEILRTQATEDCRFYRLSPYFAREGEASCIERRIQAMEAIAALRSDPGFAAAARACAFFRGSPTEDRCYRTHLQDRLGLFIE